MKVVHIPDIYNITIKDLASIDEVYINGKRVYI